VRKENLLTDIQSIANMYNNAANYEERRLKRTPIHELEYALTIDLLDKYIQTNSIVLDLGAGTGIYSEYLIETKKCKMGLIDISKRELDIFKKKNPNFKEHTIFVKEQSATSLVELEDCSFDSILIMGPLYHLVNKEERETVLKSAYRILKEGGHIICSYISPHRIYKDLFDNGSQQVTDEVFMKNLSNGITFHTCEGLTAIQYRCWPSEAKREMVNSGFIVEKCRSLEGVFSYVQRDTLIHLEDESIKNRMIEIALSTCEIEDIIGSTWHFAIVGKK
jgi:S-adenosylmethionine-dependent methyltransferase